MSRLTLTLLTMLPALAFAKPWQGIIPGTSSAVDVAGKFGEPTKKLSARGQEVFIYTGVQAIKGTVQAQFKCDPQTRLVDRIDVYPEPVLDVAAIEKSYGKSCTETRSAEPCYFKKESAQKHTYFLYLKLGLAIFFKDDGQTVQSFTFLPPG